MLIEDYEAVVRLWQHCDGIGLSAADSRHGIATYLARNSGLSQTAWIDEELAGAVLAGHDGRRGFLHHLAVSELYRRQGIGSQLLRAALDALAGEGIDKVHAFLFTDNTDGCAFWTSLGWHIRRDIGIISLDIRQEL